ncbi:head-tail connector protein [Pelagibacterium sediminicola]|uniref:head-tail connector protein n=1 Tax=Pelagibacterium sediminicola TaxID=2248761 RepID=UPI000E30FF6E|nr:head-tail connector protein [Pelagibacterium sediminicola]
MTSFLLAGPAQEPVSLVQAKAHLRVDDDAEDGLIESLITAARVHIEGVTGRALLEQSWRLVRDDWPANGIVMLPVGPVQSLDEIRTYDEHGEPHIIDTEGALLDGHGIPPRVVLPGNRPSIRERLGVEIDYTAGYGKAPEDVPADLIQALLTLVAYWYENRDAVLAVGAAGIIPSGFDRILASYRRVRI